MQRRQLGQSGFDITTIGVGSWAIGGSQWGGHQDDRDSVAAIHAAVDHGVNWVDTAPIYGSGHSESVVGRAVKELPASRRPLVFTKFGVGEDRSVIVRSGSRASVLAECGDSRACRLGLDHIDLLSDALACTRTDCRTAGACRDPIDRRQVSSGRRLELLRCPASGVASHRRAAALGAASVQYSRPRAAHDVLPWCAANNVGAIGYSPLFRGLLFGTWSSDKVFGEDDARGTHKDYVGARFQRHLQAVAEIRAIANANALSVPQLCIGTLLGTPGLTGSIVGARNSHQGALIASLGVAVTGEHARMVWEIVGRLQADLTTMS